MDQATEKGSETMLAEGIYLEVKKSSIGTGSTAKTTEYRTFWATLLVSKNDEVVMVLLNDEFKPTPIRETFSQDSISKSNNWRHVTEGQNRYSQMRPYLDKLLSPSSSAPAAGDGGTKPKPAARTDSAGVKKGGWWEK